MSRLVSPPMSELLKLRAPLQDGELEVFKLLDASLHENWEIYVQPHLNGLRPDFVLLHPYKGVAIFEVKDWDLEKIEYSSVPREDEAPLLMATKNGKQFPLRSNPVEQIYTYRRELQELYCPRLGRRAELKNITGGIIFTRSSTEAAKEFLAQSMSHRKMDRYPETYPLVGQDVLEEGDLRVIFPRAVSGGGGLKDSKVLKDLRSWLVEPDVSAKQRRPLTLDKRQRDLATSRTATGYRRIKGPAGSGKSTVLAARAAQLASEGKSVLVVCFNITILNFLRDLSARWPVDTKTLMGNITWLNYHSWCKRLALQLSREGDYKRLWKNYFELLEDGQDPDDEASDSQRAQMMDAELPQFMNEILKEAGNDLYKYDAVLVDEGQDFLPGWWNNLRRVCKPEGEMLLFADATQDIYRKSAAWTDEALDGCGFAGGNWMAFPISYRLPPDLVNYAIKYTQLFLPQERRAEPVLEQGTLGLFPCKMRWVQTRKELAAEICLEEVLRLAPSADPGTLAMPDIVFVGGSKKFGLSLVKALGSKGIRTIHTYSENSWEAKKLKNYFFLGDARVKVTTTHSFKGMETRSIVLFCSNAMDSSSMALIYTGLTRVKRHRDGSFITVVSTCPELAEYGESWPDFSRKYSN